MCENENMMILGENKYYSLDCYNTHLNNNVLVVGASGSGKTRSIVIPNLLQASGSYVVSDPKGNLYKEYGDYLRARGYKVKKLDFTSPDSSIGYNFFHYIHSTMDIAKIAHLLACHKDNTIRDSFWDEASQLLIQSLIAYLMEGFTRSEQNFKNLMKLLEALDSKGDLSYNESTLDILMKKHLEKNKDSYACRTYDMVRVASDKTLRCIIASANARLGAYDTPALNKMMSRDEVNIRSIGYKKTALFVVISDTDRYMDMLANLFFTQAMNELCCFADGRADSRLPIPVRFVLDDFATNCKIEDFPRMIASIRSRGISVMLMIQAEAQLSEAYEHDGKTIIGNCDTYVYLGGNDVETAKSVAQRCDLPVQRILYMPVGDIWILRRGECPIAGKTFDIEKHMAKLKENCYSR